MSTALDQLEDRVNAVASLVRHLRCEVARLERELADRPDIPGPHPETASAAPDDRLREEVSRLRDERAQVRERIRGLIREIDQAT